MASKVTPFQATDVESIPAIHDRLVQTYRSGKTKDIQFRLVQLRKLYWALEDFHEDMVEALQVDLRKSRHESTIMETDFAKMDLLSHIQNLEKWAQDEPIPGAPFMLKTMNHRLRPEPLGTVLIIGAFNFPYQLTLVPMIGAISAGNTVLIKPSEHSPACAMAMGKLLSRLDPDCYAIANGDLPVSKALLDRKWDKICFTGGKATGTIIAKKAAETLTPTLLELGGLNPAFLTRHGNVKLAARRLLWGKVVNAGQVCLSQNAVFVDRAVVPSFIAALHASYREFMPKGALNDPTYARLPNRATFDRLKGMLEQTRGKVVVGGGMDESRLLIEPTIVLTEDLEDSMLINESFGPLWSIVPYDSLDAAIDAANSLDSTPLAMYTFGSDAENDKILSRVTSGGATINDSYTHSMGFAPLGGVGQSGQGMYRMQYSFRAFSHYRTVANVPAWFDMFLRARYMPYSAKELARFRSMSAGKVDFDRNGHVSRGLGYFLGLFLTLGGSSAKHTVFRWAFLLAVAATALRLRTRL